MSLKKKAVDLKTYEEGLAAFPVTDNFLPGKQAKKPGAR